MSDILRGLLVILISLIGAAAHAEDANNAFLTRAQSGDCTGYLRFAQKALVSTTEQESEAWVAARAGGCAARAGDLDLASRLGVRLMQSGPSIGQDMFFVLARVYGAHVADAPRGGPVVVMFFERLSRDSPNLTSAWPMLQTVRAQAFFAADRVEEGRALLDEDSLATQVDRRYQAIWKTPDALVSLPRAPAQKTEEVKSQRETQQALSDRIDWPLRWREIDRLVRENQIEASTTLYEDVVTPGDEENDLILRRVALSFLAPALVLSDRSDKALVLLTPVTQGSGQEFDDLRALRAYAAGAAAMPLSGLSWNNALLCEYPQVEAARMLINALDDPLRRSDSLRQLNLPRSGPLLGRADEDYRRRWAALMARPDVAAAIARHGRVLPPTLAQMLR